MLNLKMHRLVYILLQLQIQLLLELGFKIKYFFIFKKTYNTWKTNP